MAMASAKLKKKDKQYHQLVQGTSKLHRDIADLETAYHLHKQNVDEDQTNVRGIIRKEIGGSRWAHGGAGKLTTYKSSKDLIDQENDVPYLDSTRTQQSSRKNQTSIENKAKILTSDRNECENSEFDKGSSLAKADKLLDLKTKVLKKASSHVIRRDNWSVPTNRKSAKLTNRNVTSAKTDHDNDENKNVKAKVNPKQHKSSTAKRNNSLKRETNGSSRSPSYIAQKSKENKQKKIQAQDSKKEVNETSNNATPEQNTTQSQRRARIDIFKGNGATELPSRHVDDLKVVENGVDNVAKVGNESERLISITSSPTKVQSNLNADTKRESTARFFQTQPLEPAEIFIDPRKGQVRVTAGNEDSFRDDSSLERTRVLIQPESLHNSVDGNNFTCSVVDTGLNSSPNKEIRNIFGLEGFNLRSNSPDILGRYGTSTSPFAAARQCNTEVEFWLRGLGIADVDRYVRIFAENEVDLTDLEFMSVSQLHDMGVTAFGALDKILKGVRDLKNLPSTQVDSSTGFQNSNTNLQSSSIAWEDINGRQKKNTSEDKSKHKASKYNDSCHHETFVKQPDEFSLFGCGERSSSSAVTNVSENCESARISARSDNPSFASSTKSSSAKCTEKRPPSAKNTCTQSITCCNQSQSKSVNQTTAKIKRSNSSASDKPLSKMTNLEAKPTKSVLLRPRSSSLSRELGRGIRETQGKKTDEKRPDKRQEEKKEHRQFRSRSRSADAVKRKALEGVHAAAKKFEDRRTKESEKNFPPRDERKKLRRDEMAARHIQREKYRGQTAVDGNTSDSDENVQSQAPGDLDHGLEKLVTVNILSPPGISDPRVSPSTQVDKGKTYKVRQDMRKSRQSRKQSYNAIKPVELQMEPEKELSLLSTYKISNKARDKSHREPESGYRTEGSESYSQISDKVSDIQLKIKRLKARATCGDDMTLTLVHDLHGQLLHFERQLKQKENEEIVQHSDPESTRTAASVETKRTTIPKSAARKLPFHDGDSSTSPVLGLVVDGGAQSEAGNERCVVAGVRRSRRELLDEMRKEKQQHHRQIRELQSELQRFKYSDPVTSLELAHGDISYKQDDLIDEGTFSCVYKGEYQGSEVAVKQLKMPLQQQDRNYFVAEVSLLKELRHPRVVLLIGVCTSCRLPLMILEYMSHGNLHSYLHNPQRECLDHALYYQIARDIALGMNYLHSHKPEVLHLDLKSMNILLCQSLRAKIADFGFSKLRLDAGLKSGRKGKSKSSGGPPSWTSPELLDKGEITGKSDVYSFAIILWEMLSRCSPYKHCSVFQILEMVRRNKRPEIPDGTPEGLCHLVKLCWDPNPAKRPQFKDILQILENLAFPPAWRELFQKAGVPDSALQDVQSTRTIISLVTGTLDSGNSGTLHSFIVAHSERGNQSNRKHIGETNSTFNGEKVFSKKNDDKKPNSKDNSKDLRRSQRESSRTSNTIEADWDSDTVTSISGKLSSDESEFTLKNLRSSSDCSEYFESDESSVLTSDEENVYQQFSERQIMPKTEINVVIPNLELSLQSAREEFRAERERISRESDWISVSLDDRTYRDDPEVIYRTSISENVENDHSDMRLSLSSGLSSISPIPSIPIKGDTSAMNESARSRRRNKAKDVILYTEEFLMRESFDNRRPPSPKKKKSMTKKFMKSSGRPTVVGSLTSSEDLSKGIKSKSAKSESFVEKSYDSFFDLSVKRPGSAASVPASRKADSLEDAKQTDDVDYESKQADVCISEPVRMSQNMEPTGRKSVSCEGEICIEDMENEVESERLNHGKLTTSQNNSYHQSELVYENSNGNSDIGKIYSGNTSQLSGIDNIDTGNRSKKLHTENVSNRNISQRSDMEQNDSVNKSQKFDIEPINTGNKRLQSYEDWNKPHRPDIRDINSENKSQMADNGNSSCKYTSQWSDIGVLNGGIKSQRSDTGYIGSDMKSQSFDIDLTKNDNNSQKSHTEFIKSRNKTSLGSGSVESELSKQSETNVLKETKNTSKLDQSISGNFTVKPLIKKQTESENDGIRVVLNQMLASRDMTLSASYASAVRSPDMVTAPGSFTSRSIDENTLKTDETNQCVTENPEQIRVKLDLNELEERKKKPAVTPRKSLKVKIVSKMSNEVKIGGQLKTGQEQYTDEVNVKEVGATDSDNIKSICNEVSAHKGNISNQSSKSSVGTSPDKLYSKSISMSQQVDKVHDGGSAPKKKHVSRRRGTSNYTNSPSSSLTIAEKPDKETPPGMTDNILSPKKNIIRVKLKKDPLASHLSSEASSALKKEPLALGRELSSPVPPAPPPPPPQIMRSVALVSRSVQHQAPRGSIADELKSRLAIRQSVSEGMLRGNKLESSGSMVLKKQSPRPAARSVQIPVLAEGGLVKISEIDERLAPQQSDGLPSFVVQSMDLQDQKDQLRSISKRHPHQFDDLSNASQEQLSSIADILRKAVLGRRLALGEDGDSVTQSLESAATGWSIDT